MIGRDSPPLSIACAPAPPPASWEGCLASLTAVLGAPRDVALSKADCCAGWWRGDGRDGSIMLVMSDGALLVRADRVRAWRQWHLSDRRPITAPVDAAREALAFMGWASLPDRSASAPCPDCGAAVERADGEIRTSHPPQWAMRCTRCEWTGFRLAGNDGDR